MQAKTKQGLQTLRRAHSFLMAREFTAALGELKPHVEALAVLVARLEQHAMEQDNRERSARAGTDAKRALARALRQEYLRPLGWKWLFIVLAHAAKLSFSSASNGASLSPKS